MCVGVQTQLAMPCTVISCLSFSNHIMAGNPSGSGRHSKHFLPIHLHPDGQYQPDNSTSPIYSNQNFSPGAPYPIGTHWVYPSNPSPAPAPSVQPPAYPTYYSLPGREPLQTDTALKLGSLRSDDIDGLFEVVHDLFGQVDKNQLQEVGNHLVLTGDWMARNVKPLGKFVFKC